MSRQDSTHISRRQFVQGVWSAAALAAAAHGGPVAAQPPRTASTDRDRPNAGIVLKSVKWEMVQEGGSVLEKFQLQQELGFDGVELISPSSLDKRDVLAASHKTSMPIHGVVDTIHWEQRLSSPDPQIRARGLNALKEAIGDSSYYGGSSVLLVPGKVTGADETHDDVWQRSIGEIRKAIPLAARLGIRILIENVWNGFCETPELLRTYIDEIASPWVGAYFDIGNHQKFSDSANWIRVLGHRIVKLDVKDWGRRNGFCEIGDGDVDWPEVRRALAEIRFTGWCTAEVTGGGRERLRKIAQQMDEHLGL
jgi:hexulose-6-phosphate isomerase